jgi:hypothetical protein
MAIHIRRREFIVTIGGAAVAWPLVAQTQQPATPVIRRHNQRRNGRSASVFPSAR